MTINEAEKPAIKKAILIGIDGLQYEKILALTTPNFDRLTLKKAYTGGINGYGSQQATSSGPGWATILTGVWANKHKITSNGSGLASTDYPSIFKRLHDHNANLKQASIQHWDTPNKTYFKNDVTVVDRIENGINDEAVTNAAIEEINKGTDFIFIHLDDPDHVGHADGFGGSYNNSVTTADRQLGRILDAIDTAQSSSQQEWLVLVTTDHGREASGYGHGSQTTSQKTVFIATNKNLNDEFLTTATPSINDFEGLYGYASQASLVPTILSYLDIPTQKEWKLDGPSLFGEIGIRKLMPSSQATLAWRSGSTKNVEIYKNGKLIDTVTANQQQWTDTVRQQEPLSDYVVALNDNPVAYRAQHLDITAALTWGTNPAYFFRSDEKYVRYNTDTDKASDGYPKATDDYTWPGLEAYKSLIVASFTYDEDTSYFFLSDGNYISYDINKDEAHDGYPKPIKGNWPGLESYDKKIVATLRWKADYVYFFTSDGFYLRFGFNDNKIGDNYPAKITDGNWPGLGNYIQDITSAVKWNDSTAYFFLKNKKYIRYSITEDKSDSGYPKTIDDTTWNGLLTP